jgi:hypothetical protein
VDSSVIYVQPSNWSAHGSKHMVQVGASYQRLSLGKNHEPCIKKWCAVSNVAHSHVSKSGAWNHVSKSGAWFQFSFFLLIDHVSVFASSKKWCVDHVSKSGAYKYSKVLLSIQEDRKAVSTQCNPRWVRAFCIQEQIKN